MPPLRRAIAHLERSRTPGTGRGVATRVIWEVFETVRGAQELKRECEKRGIPQVGVATKRGRWRTASAGWDASVQGELVLRLGCEPGKRGKAVVCERARREGKRGAEGRGGGPGGGV